MSVSIRQHVRYSTAKPKAAAAAKPYKRDSVIHTTNSTNIGYRSTEQRGRAWTDADLAILRELFGKAPSSEIAKLLNRKVASVNHRASCLGLGK